MSNPITFAICPEEATMGEVFGHPQLAVRTHPALISRALATNAEGASNFSEETARMDPSWSQATTAATPDFDRLLKEASQLNFIAWGGGGLQAVEVTSFQDPGMAVRRGGGIEEFCQL
ncbi:Dynein heavy chain, cytoplasmic [Sesbania bispinosa]|nr:Dynein heavy chain, cytoplasmic [Sesbania bispinosa]